MDFPSSFRAWLKDVLAEPVPKEVVAFSFNLFESAGVDGVNFGVKLVGAPDFDPDNSDWACDEVWEVNPRTLDIPVVFSGTEWDASLKRMTSLIQSVLDSNSPESNTLKSRNAVVVGFVDGDLDVVWSTKP